jgi:hypothetical protein
VSGFSASKVTNVAYNNYTEEKKFIRRLCKDALLSRNGEFQPGGKSMNDTQKIKIGCVLLLTQIVMLAMTLGFSSLLDRQAERDGIYTIITDGK